jgi:glycosyltransferase involved in cell wall biosynthesis
VLAKGNGYPVEWAFNAGVPVLGSDIPAMNELGAGAALLSPPGDLQQQAHSLMMIYKDEQLRNSLIAKGRERILKLNRHNTLMAYASVVRNFCG